MYDVITDTLRRFALQRSLATRPCAHLPAPDAVAPERATCRPCEQGGDDWVKVRMCLTCGAVGCCDSSPGRHASAHAGAAEHPIIRSLEPGEDWSWCFVDQLGMRIPQIHGETRIHPSPLM